MSVKKKTKVAGTVLTNGAVHRGGARVTIRPGTKSASRRPGKPVRRRKLLRHAGTAMDLPADAARNLDHYLYGHAKQ